MTYNVYRITYNALKLMLNIIPVSRNGVIRTTLYVLRQRGAV